ncbi:MAG: penicillin-binding protein 2 [Armatimonadota bacterium]|nr:penicillin-binding protein 2 [Armatimonadota bacterium]MDR7437917.1 penicillin-binding protein 2 [Armatimonadota bacterium]MDR7472142.1 penicillin-binding protein 2 [Armatimonadota bacterium]MDR7508744.1 penicillin-binding protein 2 [Armatimonadota bacterium]MDR7517733.1 penicillin-binding protein 2 [Armatimonadota bacterium]
MVDTPPPTRRLQAFSAVVAVLLGILLVRLWQVQVLQGAAYFRQSEDNRIREYTLAAPRGIIYDRRGRPLVANRPAFTVAVLPLELRDPPTVVSRLAALLGMPAAQIEARLRAARARPFEPVRIARDVDPTVVARIEENRLDLPGVIILADPVRHYLHGTRAAHLLGYVGEIDSDELAARRAEGYRPGDLIGKAGVEKAYESLLRGVDGRLRMEVDALGRPLRVLSRQPPSPGRAVVLTVDLDIQAAAEEALRATGLEAGAVVVLDPDTGEVLALASMPTFDPNLFARGISPERWLALTSDRRRPLLNRAISATYEPGSVFKLVTATAALERGIVSRRTVFDAPGYFRLGQWTFGDLRAWGRIDFITGIAHSVNVVFYTLGYRLGGETLAEYAFRLGLGEPTGIDLPGEVAGTIPSPATKQALVGEPWYPGDAVNMSIGQGAVTVTPVQVARMVAGLATGGRVMQPHVLLAVHHDRGLERVAPVLQRQVSLRPATLAVLREGMRAVVERGSGVAARLNRVAVAGKTGSAENPRGRPHAWFAGYAPAEAPQVVVVAFVEHGFRGGIAAAPVARAVLEAALARPEASP